MNCNLGSKMISLLLISSALLPRSRVLGADTHKDLLLFESNSRGVQKAEGIIKLNASSLDQIKKLSKPLSVIFSRMTKFVEEDFYSHIEDWKQKDRLEEAWPNLNLITSTQIANFIEVSSLLPPSNKSILLPEYQYTLEMKSRAIGGLISEKRTILASDRDDEGKEDTRSRAYFITAWTQSVYERALESVMRMKNLTNHLPNQLVTQNRNLNVTHILILKRKNRSISLITNNVNHDQEHDEMSFETMGLLNCTQILIKPLHEKRLLDIDLGHFMKPNCADGEIFGKVLVDIIRSTAARRRNSSKKELMNGPKLVKLLGEATEAANDPRFMDEIVRLGASSCFEVYSGMYSIFQLSREEALAKTHNYLNILLMGKPAMMEKAKNELGRYIRQFDLI